MSTSPERQGVGQAVALHGDVALIAAPGTDTGGEVLAFDRVDGEWNHSATITQPLFSVEWGTRLAMCGDVALVGDRTSRIDQLHRVSGSWTGPDWPIRKVLLGEEELTDPRDTSMVDERLALVEIFTRQQWAFAGREIPTYSRAEMPGTILRPR